MKDTLKQSGGVGLAAPQVGILRRVVVIDIGEGLQKAINAAVGEMLGQEVNVYIYSSSFDGEKAVVLGDVYESDGPDALGAYLHHCQLTLQYEPEKLLLSFSGQV